MNPQKHPMEPQRRLILVNAGIAGGLVVSYLEGSPLWILALCGIFLTVLANVVMLMKFHKAPAGLTEEEK